MLVSSRRARVVRPRCPRCSRRRADRPPTSHPHPSVSPSIVSGVTLNHQRKLNQCKVGRRKRSWALRRRSRWAGQRGSKWRVRRACATTGRGPACRPSSRQAGARSGMWSSRERQPEEAVPLVVWRSYREPGRRRGQVQGAARAPAAATRQVSCAAGLAGSCAQGARSALSSRLPLPAGEPDGLRLRDLQQWRGGGVRGERRRR